MDVFFGEWINLLLRWAHLIVGIGWIGTSFYFVALDLSLFTRERPAPGVLGTAWQVHGGGFYHVEKYTVAPPHLPEHLHWFRWEAYLTWVTGFGLLIIQYYLHANAYLIDPSVLALDPWQAIAISVASIGVGWMVYDGLCRSGISDKLIAPIVFVLILLSSVLYTRVYSGRGAFIHVGALVGTIMAVNVFAVIIPNQKKMVAQLLRGEEPDARYGKIGKQRSVHNNYLTLPVLVMMVSPHYPFLFSHPHAWLIVALILISGGLIRHFINRSDAGDDWHRYSWTVFVAAAALLTAIFVTAPHTATDASIGRIADAEAMTIVTTHCVMCHAQKPTNPAFEAPPKGVMLETLAELRQYASLVYAQAVENKAMPLGNQTGMTEEERARLGAWIRSLK